MRTQQGEILLEVLQLNLHKACNNGNTAPDVTSVLSCFFFLFFSLNVRTLIRRSLFFCR